LTLPILIKNSSTEGNNRMFVYCQFSGKWAECYEFDAESFQRIAAGDVQPLYDAGVTRFNRVTVDDGSGQREVWSKRPSRTQNDQ